MPVTGSPIEPKNREESDALEAKLKACKTAKEIGSTAGVFVSS
jgi:hypothetical protein